MNRRNAGVLQLPRDLRLCDESSTSWGIGGVVLARQLDRHLAIEPSVQTPIDNRHAAPTDLLAALIHANLCDGLLWIFPTGRRFRAHRCISFVTCYASRRTANIVTSS